jgi:dTDP-4-amino-4,6-dideoxygalactose transaminase
VFSFHPRKAITTGEGGMITSNDDNLIQIIQQLRDHGAVKSDLQRHLGNQPYLLADHVHAGYNQRMTDIQGALGNNQMDRANEIISERKQIAQMYIEAFADIELLRTPITPDDCSHGYQSFACLYGAQDINQKVSIRQLNEKRNTWMAELQENGISTRPATHAVHMLSFYQKKYGLKPSDFPNAQIANECSISLPLFHGMTKEEVEYVILTVRKTISLKKNI